MSGCQVVEYRPEHKEQVVRLHSDALGLAPLESQHYLEWKYERNPYLREPILFLARDGLGAIVGMRGFYGTCWNVHGQRVVIPCADDFAIAPHERNTGLMTAIMRVALESLRQRGFSHVLNASGGTLTVLQSMAMGWRSLGAMEPVARLSRVERIRQAVDSKVQGKRLVWRLAREPREGDAACFERLDQRGNWSSPDGNRFTVDDAPRAEAMAELVERVPNDGRFRHVRDRSFFDWRFDNPTRDYRFLYLERKGVLTGFLVVARYYRWRIPFNIVDWEASSDGVHAALLQRTLKSGRFNAIGAWSASLSEDCRRLLTQHDFAATDLERRSRGMPCVLLKNLRSAQGNELSTDRAQWDIRLIDSMHG